MVLSHAAWYPNVEAGTSPAGVKGWPLMEGKIDGIHYEIDEALWFNPDGSESVKTCFIPRVFHSQNAAGEWDVEEVAEWYDPSIDGSRESFSSEIHAMMWVKWIIRNLEANPLKGCADA